MRIVSGIQSSGRLHLGNYLGALRQFLELQKEGETFFFIADLHALTTIRDRERFRTLAREAAMTYLALGLDPERAVLYRQSDLPEVAELFWILGTVVPLSNLERAHSYKDKVAKGIAPDFGLFAYPVLMAADILLYDGDVVPVGKDQQQHVELARDWATKFNVTYVPGYDPADPTGEKSGKPGVLKLPAARIQKETATVPGIDGQKMSKSYNNTIELFASDSAVKKRIMGIRTDSTPVEAPKPVEDSPLHVLLTLMSTPEERRELHESWTSGGQGYGYYKKQLLERFHRELGPARQRYAELERAPEEVDRVLAEGAARARQVGSKVLRRVKDAVGL